MTTETVDGVTVKRLWTWQPTRADPGFLSRLSYYVLFAIHAFAWLSVTCRRHDVVVTTTPPIFTGIAGIPAVLSDCRWVVDVRDLWIDASVSLGFISEGGVLERVSRQFQRRVLLYADSIGVTTETLGECLCEEYGEELASKVQLVPNGVDVSQFHENGASEPLTESTNTTQIGPSAESRGLAQNGGTDTATNDGGKTNAHDEFVVIYTGNIGHAQDLDICLHALAELPDEVVLRLVGGGDAVPHLQELAAELGIADRVEFVGTVAHEEIPRYLADADVGIAPLRDDEELAYAMPTKVYEYLGCELPAVVTGNGELRRFIQESGGGIHADNDPESIKAAIETLLESERRRREMGRSGYEFVRNEYDRERIASRFNSHLVALTDQRRTHPRTQDT